MAQLVVRKIESEVKSRLKRRARWHGWSIEKEVRDILRNAANGAANPARGLGTEIASLFVKVGLDAEIPELRGHVIKPAAAPSMVPDSY